MAESFEDRVKRLFGSKLFESVPENSFPSSSWSVAHGDVERREWNRDRNLGHERDEDAGPCAPSFYGDDGCLLKNKKKSRRDKVREFEGDLDDLDDDEEENGDEEEDRERGGRDDEEREEREIRNSIGLDPTLDNEEEEDEYDKAALCRENATERVYMRDVKDPGPCINYHDVVPDFLDEPDDSHYFHKDPRADHLAANARLKEDQNIAGSGETSRASSVKIADNDVNLKPILKRKEPQIEPKPKKRVRFDPGHKDDHNEVYEEPQDFPTVPQSTETSEASKFDTSIPKESPGVPDYLRNPSKYTHYTFDLSDCNDEETNRRAFEDFRNLVNKSKPNELQSDVIVELPKSVTFTPRKKSTDAVPMDDSPANRKEHGQVLGCILATDTDACEMDEDDVEAPTAVADSRVRRGRQYRSKSVPDDSS